MKKRLVLPICAALGVLLAIIAVIISHLNPPPPPIPFPPPVPPYKHFISTVGMTLSTPDNVAIGTPLNEIVDKVFVESGSFVKKGEPLFQLNTLRLKAKLLEAEAAFRVAEARYQRMLDLPRPEEIPVSSSRLQQSEAKYLDLQEQFALYENISNPKAVSLDAHNQRRFAALAGKYAFEAMQHEHNVFMKGAWVRDLEIVRAEMRQAELAVQIIALDIERSTVRAPFTGVALRVCVNPGEYADASRDNCPALITFGALEPLDILVEVDEEDVWRVIEGAPAVAYVRGNSALSVPLHFLHITPYLVRKKSFVGGDSERTDTRVLQIRYRIESPDFPLYAGQMMDVVMEAKPHKEEKE